MKRAILTVAALTIACSGLLYSYGDVPAPVPAGNEEFAGKILLLYMDNTMQMPCQTLKDVQIHEVNGERFLSGTGADTKRNKDWRSGLKISVRWARVAGFIQFTPEEFAKFCEDDSRDEVDRRL